MKKIIFVLCLWPLSLFATGSFFDGLGLDENEAHVSYYHGKGKLIDHQGLASHYLVSLEIRSTNHGAMFTFNVVSDELSYSRQLLFSRSSEFDGGFHIFAPVADAFPSAEAIEIDGPVATHVKVGWGHEVSFDTEGLAKTQGLLLNYTIDGKHISRHWTIDQIDGMKVLRKTGSVVSNGRMVHSWADVLRQVL